MRTNDRLADYIVNRCVHLFEHTRVHVGCNLFLGLGVSLVGWLSFVLW